MIAVLIRIKNHTPVINRQHLLQALFHPHIPKLQVAAVRFLPVLGQVNDHVQPSLDVKLFVQPKIRVHAEEAAGFGFVQAAAGEIRVGDQALDAGEFFEEFEHGRGVEGVEDVLQVGAAGVGADLAFELAFVAAFVDLFVVGRFDGEVFADAGDDVGLQEVVDDDVWEWRGLGVFVGQRFAESAGGGLVEVEFRGQADGECLRVGLHCRSDVLGFQGWANSGWGLARCLCLLAEYSGEQVAMSAIGCRVSFA